MVTLPIRDLKPCCTTMSRATSTLPWCGAQSKDPSQYCPSPWPRMPIVFCEQYLPPVAPINGSTYPDSPSQNPQTPCTVGSWGIPPICMHPQQGIQLPVRSSVDIQKEEDPADFSVPYQILWLARNIRRKNHWRHLLLILDIILPSIWMTTGGSSYFRKQVLSFWNAGE